MLDVDMCSIRRTSTTYVGGLPITSTIEYFDWDPDTMTGNLGVFVNQQYKVLVNLSTSESAGPLAVDKVRV